jgi:2-polyprenyl-6-methoxyphenol hydroxylase-like FAD-dependent oxidoreductase
MAIEDAVVLAQELAAADHVDAALSAYNARRIPRAQLVYDNSLRICEIEKTPSPDSMAATGVLIESFKFLAQPY